MQTILIIHITDNQLELEDEEDREYFCNSVQKMNYKILYSPLPISNESAEDNFMRRLKIITKKISTSKKKINAIFIYGEEQEIKDKTFMISVLARVYHAYKDDNIYCLYLVNSEELVIKNREIALYAEQNHLENVRYKRFLNVLRSEERVLKVIGTFKRLIREDYEILIFPDKNMFENMDTLRCQWWFNYLIVLFSECGKGRLLQLSGTCYLNAIINGIILSPRLRKMMLMYLNNKFESSDKEQLSEFLKKDILACLDFEKPKYFYKLLYDIFCKKTKITEFLSSKNAETDILIEYSKYFSPETSGQGGSFRNTFYKLLDDCTDDKKIYFRKGDDIKTKDSKDIFVIEGHEETNNFISRKDFSNVEFAYISVQGKYISGPRQGERAGHGMCGFICNKIFYIYDSATNMFFLINWTDHTDLENFLDEYNSFNDYLIKYEYIYFQALVLSNPKRWEMYERLGVCPEI